MYGFLYLYSRRRDKKRGAIIIWKDIQFITYSGFLTWIQSRFQRTTLVFN